MPNPAEEEYKNLVSQIQSQNIKITPELEALAEQIWNSPSIPYPSVEYEALVDQLDQAEYSQHEASRSQSTSNPNPPMGKGWDHHTPPERY